jgi:cytochrome c
MFDTMTLTKVTGAVCGSLLVYLFISWAGDSLYATADPAAGEKVFKKCSACHKVDGSNGTGPHLNGVVGRARASIAEFGYSDGMKSVTDPWTPEALEVFLTNPKGAVAGTKMAFAGLPKVEDRANLIAYLATLP